MHLGELAAGGSLLPEDPDAVFDAFTNWAAAAGLLLYLTYALLRPERF